MRNTAKEFMIDSDKSDMIILMIASGREHLEGQ